MTLIRRVERLEAKHGGRGPSVDMIRIIYVSPGPDGPMEAEPSSVYIVSGPNAGMELSKADDESSDAFEARCNEMLVGKR